MSKFVWCILIALLLLLVSCDSAQETSSISDHSSQGVSVAFSEESSASAVLSSFSDEALESSDESEESVLDASSAVESSEMSDELSAEQSNASSDFVESSDRNESSADVSDESEEHDESSDSSGGQSDISSESSAEVSEESHDQPPVNISTVDRKNNRVNVAQGKSYTVDLNSHTQYPDKGNKLTDGVAKTSFDSDNWVGYAPPKTTVIVLDLGKTESELADFGVAILRLLDYGIGSPEQIIYEISTDGKTYKKIGTVYRPKDVSSVSSYSYDLKLAVPVSARYVRYTLKGTNSSWLFVGELYAVRYTEKEIPKSYYDEFELPQVTGPNYWPDNATDRDKTINLIAGKTPFVESSDVIIADFATEYYNSKIVLPKLTDGAFAKKSTYSDSALVHFTRGSDRYVYFDMGYTSAVSGVVYSFLNEISSGVYVPSAFSVYLSDNGVDWQRVYTAQPGTANSSELYKKTVTFDKVYKARFVKFSFSVSSHAFCDELQILGTKSIPSSAVSIKPDANKEPEKLGYAMPDDFLGVHNVFLSYHCLPNNGAHSENGLITVDEYLPHVGYYDKSGKLADTFFDAFLYLPYTSFNFSDYACSLEGWKFYLDDIYTSDRNMDALNQAVEIVKNELNKPDYTCTVFTSILYPWQKLYVSKTPNTFGDLDGDGKKDAFSSLENRKKAVKWMMDQEYNRFMEGNYENLTFGGFYWFEEAITVGDPNDKELINYAADYAHSLGVKIFWIPYYCASGYDRWQEYGFDLACMQPNYMFGNSNDPSVLESTAEKTQRLGMCVEIEMNSLGREEVMRYLEYLAAGEKYGYMHAVKIYYQGGVPGVVHAAYKSNNAFERSVYDLTYLFAKEKFSAKVPTVETPQLEYTCTGTTLEGEPIAVSDGSFQLLLSVSPSHGDLRMNENGSFIYYANDGYKGKDYFSVYLDYGYGQSEEIVITISVE